MNPKEAFRLILPVLFFFSALSALPGASVSFEVLGDFDYPGSTVAHGRAINDHGDVAGDFGFAARRGFVRLRNGQFSDPIVHPDDQNHYTAITGINNLKTLCGYYSSHMHWHSFFLSGDTLTEITTDGLEPLVYGLNDAGNVCGITMMRPEGAFVTISGTSTPFEIPGSSYTEALGINNLDQCVGDYLFGTTGEGAGFRRDADGTLTYPFRVRGTNFTSLSGINDTGSMVGIMRDPTTSANHAVFFNRAGMSTVYDYPGAFSTSFTGINNRGLICGYYDDGTGVHTFIVRVRPAAGK